MTSPETRKVFSATLLSIFPEMFPGPLGHSLAGKAMESGIWDMDVVNIRDYAKDRHKTVDDTPFGGGAGMVMRADVLNDAIEANHTPGNPLVYLSPRGRVFDQTKAKELAEKPGITLLCGRFEGIDERVIKAQEIEEISIGDFVLSGGEPAAIILLDAVIRLLPGVVGKTESLEFESFEQGLLEYPHYTRPRTWSGMDVPEILVSGHHERIANWRKERSEDITRTRRPDLWEKYAERLSDKG